MIQLQSKYQSLLDFDDEFYGKDFKNNYKFIDSAVKRMLKQKEADNDIKAFIQDAIDIHIRIYKGE